VHLVRGDQLRLARKRRLKKLELAANRIEIVYGIASGGARHVDEVHEDLRPLEMPQELVAQTEAAMRALDETRNVGENEAAIVGSFVHERARRHIELEIGASMAGAIRTLPVVAARRAELRMEAVVDQRIRVRVGDDEDRSAVAAVAAARAAARHELLATEGET